ncbi:MAG: aminodeoxychorismate lyase [Betaproteobacteria bacterium]|nr:aminodeoxychorismate lyase [Betaproteobacteria bacterium]
MILVNGSAGGKVDAVDRGLAYGDGVFRTLALRHGSPRCWPRHYRKLERDCRALALTCPTQEILRNEIALLARHEPDCAAKIIVTRGCGLRGYAPPGNVQTTRIVMSAPLPRYPAEFADAGVTARLCTLRLGLQPALAGIKHLNRLENVLARAEWSDPEIAEGLMLDAEGSVIGGTMTNLFVVERGILLTPDLSRCGVAGVTRERIMEAAARHGVVCTVDRLFPERIFAAEEVFLVNSLIGLWQVRSLEASSWPRGIWVERMRQWLDEQDD